MPWVTRPQCEICGVLRQDTNHWWQARRVDDGTGGVALVITPLPKVGQDDPDTTIACGEKCLHAVLSQFIASRKGGS